MSTDKSAPQSDSPKSDSPQDEAQVASPIQETPATESVLTDPIATESTPAETPVTEAAKPAVPEVAVTAPVEENSQASGSENAAVTPQAPVAEAESSGAPAEGTPAPEAASPKDEGSKLKLNPTTTPLDARPVPSLGGEAGFVPPVPEGPIELPGANDDEIEAEVAKALSGGESTSSTTADSTSTSEAGAPVKSSVDSSIEAAIEQAMGGADAQAEGEEIPQQKLDPEDLEPGQKLSGIVQSVSGDNVFLDFGMRLSGVVPLKSFGSKGAPKPEETLEVLFEQVSDEEGLILTRLPGGVAAAVQSSDWDYLQKGQMVEALVKKTNKGGLEVTVGSLRGFIPASQIDLGFVEDMEVYVGKKVTAEITELKPAKKNLVLSRRKVLNARRADAKKLLMEELKPDQVRTGIIKTIKDYGAFVDLGGTDGFLPISQISWIRIGHPSEVISEGQEIEVKVLSIDREKDKISLGMRQLTQNPWKVAESKYEKGSNVTGRVTKTETFGAFVELEPGIEGLVHISELEHRRVKRVTEVLKVGDMIEVQVLEVDPGKKRISLSMKALKAKPEPVDRPEEPEVEKYERKRKGPLKGGTGSEGGGGLFGNPGDFGK
ncbi:S1 RNA-binding domain-containing protein [Thalassoglobus sp.]|uniref:30S ribosomal protein S1 n=1 Tax=Thalassoglobus sp. TaxID=2795869 RepID=UPI003AA818E7